ncbi:uncharacterized protein VP01_9254g1, partial [Puccinia sorghi]
CAKSGNKGVNASSERIRTSSRDYEDVCAAQKANLEEQTRVTSIVAAVAKKFNPSNILKLEGSNLRQWERMLWLHASERFGNTDFFAPEDGVVSNPANKKIGRGIINSLVHTDLTYDLLDLPSLAAVFDHLMLKFHVVNREAQIQAWLSFINTEPGKNKNTAKLHKAFRNTVWYSSMLKN